MKKSSKWTSLNKVLLLIIIMSMFFTGCKLSAPTRDMNIDRDTSKNTVIYEIFDDGNCQGGICEPPEEYK